MSFTYSRYIQNILVMSAAWSIYIDFKGGSWTCPSGFFERYGFCGCFADCLRKVRGRITIHRGCGGQCWLIILAGVVHVMLDFHRTSNGRFG